MADIKQEETERLVSCNITPDSDVVINISKALIYNQIIIKSIDIVPIDEFKDEQAQKKDARSMGIAKTYHQYMSKHFDFAYYEAVSDKYARENKGQDVFQNTAKICNRIFNAKIGISPYVFSGITAVVVESGYEKEAKRGVDAICDTFAKIKNGMLSLMDFEDGDPVQELCRFLVRRRDSVRSNLARSMSAKITCAFWNAYLENGRLDRPHKIVAISSFVTLRCCPVPGLKKEAKANVKAPACAGASKLG